MASRHQWKRTLAVAEAASLLILITSLIILGHGAPDQQPANPYWLLVPALASLTTFLSFLGLMYLRWAASDFTGSRQRIHQLLFAILALTLLSVWAFAISQTWHSLNDAKAKPSSNLLREQ